MRTFLCIAVIVALTACTTGAPSPQTQNTITNSIVTACTIANVASAGFDAYVAAKPGRIDDKGLKWKAGVLAALKPICDNPAAVADPQKALTVVVQMGFALSDFITGVDKAPVP